MLPIYKKILDNAKTKKNIPETMLCLDPGGTIGVAVFTNGTLSAVDQVPGYDDKKLYWEEIEQLLEKYKPTFIAYEEYKIYAHKLEQHSFSDVKTLRIIGMIQYWCWKNQVPYVTTMAQTHKMFVTDDKLKRWGFWQSGMRHSRDAIRVGLYQIICGKGV